jgi:type VI protein secretion system component VasK
MSLLETRLKAAFTAVATDIKGLTTNQGSLATLTTTAKGSLVAALNELKGAVDAASAALGAQIDDATTVANKTWSSNKINTSIASAINALLNNAPAAFDTLKELADQLAADQSALTAITTALSHRVRVDAAQTLSTAEQKQAAANIGLGDIDADLAAHYTAAKA